MKKECTVDECQSEAYVRGMCNAHYRRVRRNGSTDEPRRPPTIGEPCSIEGCTGAHLAKGLCVKHYQRTVKYGTTDLPVREIQICSNFECSKKAFARGMCPGHYGSSRTDEPRDCKVCGRTQPEVSFNGYRKMCNACSYRANKTMYRESNLRRNYGIDLAEFERIFDLQSRCCAICKSSTSNGRSDKFHVDHDHETGKVRGVLCRGCNLAIGHLKENSTSARDLADYLDSHSLV